MAFYQTLSVDSILEPKVLLLGAIFIVSNYFLFKRIFGTKKLPPGSLGWPVVGETVQFLHNPAKFVVTRMGKYSNEVFKTNILGENTAVLCGPAGNKFMFTNEQKLVKVWHPHSTQKIFYSNKPQQAPPPPPNPTPQEAGKQGTLRSTGFLRPEAVMRYLDKIDLITKHHLDTHWEGKQEVKVYSLVKTYTLALACQLFMGVNDPDLVERLVGKFDELSHGIHTIAWNIPGMAFYGAKKAAVAISAEIQQVINQRTDAMASGVQMQDILSYMIKAGQEGKFKALGDIAEAMMGLISAGYGTTAIALTFAMKYIGERPDVYQKILAEQMEIKSSEGFNGVLDWDHIQKMKYTWNVVSETMRLRAPLQGMFREAMTDLTYAGYTIPKGWKLYWTVSSTHKNPDYFPNPEKFDPSRFEDGNTPYTFNPFGGGPRMCPGKEYARVVVLTFLHNVVTKFKWDLLCPDEKVIGDMAPAPELGVPIRLHSAT
ncbi:beta-amyrin 28-monooxygenase-like [Tripterygium wilfordii]|uniref:beta-amyrin 28-monooxygenase-like n=1 Tax=Tripterygium wilfordii TaxID=458696 RepID=UPI0018F85433|nr:beta-amyrin 28-monooxygenase-like [Tripterygium wilfordii]WEW62271.1 CYP716C52v2 protein [Tripterygium wilfordii]